MSEKGCTEEKKKEEGSMSALAQYLKTNREQAYSFATANTKYNTHGRPSVSKDDEWINESEWDDVYNLLKNTEQTEKE
ncbi:MAG: hypothetical protein K2O73_06360 [Lachnospiraceae bacterium]|nr:hypothetical protein [Lachnospiraceae bacterium]